MSGITPFLNVLDTKPGPWWPLESCPGCMLCPTAPDPCCTGVSVSEDYPGFSSTDLGATCLMQGSCIPFS